MGGKKGGIDKENVAINGADGETWTLNPLREHAPKACAYANSATSALIWF